MGFPPTSITGVSPVEAGPEPARSEVEGMALQLMGKMPMLLCPYGHTANTSVVTAGRGSSTHAASWYTLSSFLGGTTAHQVFVPI
jgi:hypothetical protein